MPSNAHDLPAADTGPPGGPRHPSILFPGSAQSRNSGWLAVAREQAGTLHRGFIHRSTSHSPIANSTPTLSSKVSTISSNGVYFICFKAHDGEFDYTRHTAAAMERARVYIFR
ncbi:hypothetical protein TCAP_04901 [Tolypocladium capitatum]|uniref:Uncharacterized protein n=1 Tax=Tolypocladium capitatum TaxID=45235 RepID=A0A2K3QC91_9HYPO|nr:hypothetical protein TCAP_04901 [Tolypocladium capitatum]